MKEIKPKKEIRVPEKKSATKLTPVPNKDKRFVERLYKTTAVESRQKIKHEQGNPSSTDKVAICSILVNNIN